MSRSGTCPICGLPLPKDAPRSLCPECLIQAALPHDSVVTEEDGDAAAEGPQAKVDPTLSHISNVKDTDGSSAWAADLAAPAAPQATSWGADRHHPRPASETPGAASLPTIEGYEILEALGEGGMGIVYRAIQNGTRRPVALKMIQHAKNHGLEQLARFRIEAEAIARLQHPNVVQIHEVREAGGQPFISLELLEGPSLAERLKPGPLPARDAAELLAILARAVHAVHEVGIVHRDLKPANVLFTKTGVLKVTDFGLAKRLDTTDGETVTGQIMGTPSYMAPEQARGETERISPATDVFALGVILYEMLTGHPPFKGTSNLETLRQINSDDPVPPSRQQRSVSRDLETICLKCLEKEPKDRYAGAKDLADDLDRYLAGAPVRARRTPVPVVALKWVRRHPAQAALAATLLAMIVGGAIWAEQASARTRLDQQNAAKLRLDTIDGLDQARRYRMNSAWNDALQAYTRLEANTRGARHADDLHRRAADELAEVQRLIKENADRSREAELFQSFQQLRNDALFLDGSSAFLADTVFGDTDASDDGARRAAPPAQDTIERTRKTARAALAVFGRDRDVRAPLPRSLSEAQRAEIETGCSLMLLVLSEAIVNPLPNEDPKKQAEDALRLLDQAAQSRAQTPALHLRRAACLDRLGDPGAAARERAEAARLAPSDEFDHFLLGLDAYRRREWGLARARFDTALNLRPDSFWSCCLLAVSELNSKPPRAAEAKTHLTACLSQHGNLPWLYLLRGTAYRALGSALSTAARTTRSPDSLAAEAEARFNDAETDFRKAQELDLEHSLQYVLAMNRGVLRFQRGDWNAATADFEEAVALDPKQSHAHASLAQSLRKLGRYEEAITELDQAIALEPENADFHRGRASARLDRDPLPPDQVEPALRDLETAARLAPSGARCAADDQARAGHLLLRLGRYREALEAAENALGLASNSSTAHLVRVSALLELERFDEAIRASDAALAAAPGVTDLYRLRGLARVARGDAPGAIDDYTEALSLAPRDRAVVLGKRGWAYLLTHSYELALRDFEAVILLDSSSSEGYAGRAAALIRLGRTRDALSDVDTSLRTEPTARMYYLAAQTFTQASLRAAEDVARHGRPASRDSLAYEARASDLLRLALERTPSSQRSTFWSNVVARDPGLAALLRNPKVIERLKPSGSPNFRAGDHP